MADRGPATIIIGGDLPESKVDEFLEVCQDYGGDPYEEWEGPFDIETREKLEEVVGDGFLVHAGVEIFFFELVMFY